MKTKLIAATAIAMALLSNPAFADKTATPTDYAQCGLYFTGMKDSRVNEVLKMYDRQVLIGRYSHSMLEDAIEEAGREFNQAATGKGKYVVAKWMNSCSKLGFKNLTR